MTQGFAQKCCSPHRTMHVEAVGVCAQSAAEVAKEAEEQLPPEPGAGDAAGCGVLVRFPDGQRRQRRFPRNATLEVLRAFCLVQSEEAAAGRPFALSESMPGELHCHVHGSVLQMRSVHKKYSCIRLHDAVL